MTLSQDRYPYRLEHEPGEEEDYVYISREFLTHEQAQWNVRRLVVNAERLLAHAHALDEWDRARTDAPKSE